MKKLILFCIFITTTLFIRAQNIDSLVHVLNTQTLKPIDQLELYMEICRLYMYSDVQKNIEYAEKGLSLAEKEKKLTMAAKFTEIIGITYLIKSNIDTASVYLEKALDLALKLADTEVKYETEKKEVRIGALEKEKKMSIWLGVAGIAILLLAFCLLLVRHRLSLQKRKLAEQQIKQLEQEKQLIATQSLLDGETAERSRLARDLHDGLGGMLSVIKLNLKDAKEPAKDNPQNIRFHNAMEMLDQTVVELRRIAHHMMPASLIRNGLKVSIEDFCRAIPGADFQYVGGNQRLDSRLEVLIYRCAYELVNNVVKHANATLINVQLMIDNGLISLTVRDDGAGFDIQKVNLGAGLENIRTRVSAYNGKMNIYSSPGNGTETNIEIELS